GPPGSSPAWRSSAPSRPPRSEGWQGATPDRRTHRDLPEEHLRRPPHPLAEGLGSVAVEPVSDRPVHETVERGGEILGAVRPAELAPLLAAREELHEELDRRRARPLSDAAFVQPQPDLRDLAKHAAVETAVLFDPGTHRLEQRTHQRGGGRDRVGEGV